MSQTNSLDTQAMGFLNCPHHFSSHRIIPPRPKLSVPPRTALPRGSKTCLCGKSFESRKSSVPTLVNLTPVNNNDDQFLLSDASDVLAIQPLTYDLTSLVDESSSSPDSSDQLILTPPLSAMDTKSLIGESAGSVHASGQSFEPVVNVPALFSFLLIAAIFTRLLTRISAINRAADRRIEALKALREIKSLQLSSSNISESGHHPTIEDVNRALSAYEAALREEESLRTIMPGVRIVAPNDPNRQEADIAAAKQFLGMDLSVNNDDDKEGDGSSADTSDGQRNLQSERGEGKTNEKKGLSNGAVAILAALALSQIVLLFVLSIDPMTANHVFNQIGGDASSL